MTKAEKKLWLTPEDLKNLGESEIIVLRTIGRWLRGRVTLPEAERLERIEDWRRMGKLPGKKLGGSD